MFRCKQLFVIYAYNANYFHETAHKYSLPSCFRHTMLGSDAQKPVYPGGSTSNSSLKRTHVLEFIKLCLKDMDFKGHPAAQFTVVFHQGLNMFHIDFGLVIPQESLKHCNKAGSRCFLRPCEFLEEFRHYNHLYLCSDEDTGLDYCHRQLRKKVLKVIQGCRQLIQSCLKLFNDVQF